MELSCIFLIFWEMELFSPSLKFFPEKNLLYFFLKKKHSKKLSYIFSKKLFLILQEMELSSPKIKKLQERTF